MANQATTAALAGVCAAITTIAAWSLLTSSWTPPQRTPLSAPTPATAIAQPSAALQAEAQNPPPAAASAPVDTAVFGALPEGLGSAAPPPRPSFIEKPTTLAFAASPLQSLAESFAQSPVEAAAPTFGAGPSPLDGPADADVAFAVAALDDRPLNTPNGKAIAFDASEGTKLDPLRNRAWDLNATQVVPPLTLR